MRIRSGLAALALAALAGPLGAGPAAAQAAPRPARQPLARPGVLVLVDQLSWADAATASRGSGAASVAGFVAALPADAPLAARVLSLAAGHRVEVPTGGIPLADPAAADRLRAANPDARLGRLPTTRVLAEPGMEAAGLLALGASGPAPAPARLPLTGRLSPRPDELLVIAVRGPTALRAVLARLPHGPVARAVLVLGLRPAPGRARAAPLLAVADGQAGVVTSASTRREGLVALEDVRPTVAGNRSADDDGVPIEVLPDDAPLATVGGLDRRVAALVLARTWAIPLLALAASLALLTTLAAWWSHRRGPGRAARLLIALTLAIPSGYLAASMVEPLAARLWPAALGGSAAWAFAWVGLGLLVAVLLAAAALRLGRAPVLLGAVLLLLVAVDLATGGGGLAQPLLGGSAWDGERFYGLGNGYFAFALAAAATVVAFSRLSAWPAAALLVGLAVVDGLPWLGADVGGALTAMLTAAAAVALLGSARPRPARLAALAALAALAVVAALALAAGIGLLGGPATHGSRFAGRLLDHPADAARTLLGHLGRNLGLLAANPFAWVGPLQVAAAALIAWRPPPALAGLPDRVRRALGLGALGSTLLILLNDTGVTATAASGLVLLAIPAWALLDGRPPPDPPPPVPATPSAVARPPAG
jgi:hypothetical protein